MQPRRSSLAAFLSRTLAAGIGLAAAIAPPAWTTAAHARQDPAAPAANLTDAQLAEVYERIHADIVAQGGVPGETPIPGNQLTSAWSPRVCDKRTYMWLLYY
jgi:hypothetical protein